MSATSVASSIPSSRSGCRSRRCAASATATRRARRPARRSLAGLSAAPPSRRLDPYRHPRGREGQLEPERASTPQLAAHRQRSLVRLGYYARDVQPEAGPRQVALHGALGTEEALEEPALIVRTDADAAVRDLQADETVTLRQRHVDDAALRRELDRVRHEVVEHLLYATAVCVHRRDCIEDTGEGDRLGGGPRLERRHRVAHDLGKVDVVPLEGQLTRLQACDEEQ